MLSACIAALLLVGLLSWLWRTNRDPLIYCTLPAVAFSPLARYAGETLGGPGAWLSARKVLVLLVLISIAFRFLKGDYSWRRIRGLWFVAPYLSVVVLSVLWSVLGPFNGDTAAILDEFADWALPVVVFLCLACTPSSEDRIAGAGQAIGITVLVLAIYCGLQSLVLIGHAEWVPSPIADLTRRGMHDFWWAPFRLYGPFTTMGPNAFGIFLLFPAAYCICRCIDTRGVSRYVWGLLALITAALIAGTFSRSAQLGLIVVVAAIPLVSGSARGLALAGVTVVLTALLLAETAVGSHFTSFYRAGGSLDPDVADRLSVWQAILSQLPDRPLGFGFDGWARASRHLLVPATRGVAGAAQPGAGQYMRELADRGVAGVALLVLMMIGFTTATIRAARRNRSGFQRAFLTAAGVGFAGWTISLVSDDHLMLDAVAGMFWYIAGLALAAIRDAPGASSSKKEPTVPTTGAQLLNRRILVAP